MTGQVRLRGFADVVGKSVGFLIPVFDSEGTNALLVQRISPAGAIVSFEQVENLDAKITYVDPLLVEEGGESIWAFAFSGNDILYDLATSFREKLASRINDPALADRPLLAIEVAEFLELREWRLEKAKSALARFGKIGSKPARAWLDISILTPDLRRELTLMNLSSHLTLSRVVASVERDAVVIRGAGLDPTDPHAEQLEKAVHTVLRQLREVYPPPSHGWRVQLLRSRARDHTAMAEAIVWLFHRRDSPVQAFIQDDFSWRIDAYRADELEEFRAAIKDAPDAAAFSVVRSHRDKMFGEMNDLIGIRAVTIVFGSLSRLRSDMPRLTEGRSQSPHFLAPLPGLPGTQIAPKALGAAVRQIVAAALAVRHEDEEAALQGGRIFLRATGNGPAPVADAWATLYDRTWGNGLSPRDAYLINGRRRSSPHEDQDLSWQQVLFREARPFRDPKVHRELGKSRVDAAVVLSIKPRDEEDYFHHSRAVVAALGYRGWSPREQKTLGQVDKIVELHRDIDLRYVRLSMEEPLGKTPWNLSNLFDRDISQVETIAVTCDADAPAILARLYLLGELSVNMRDLCTGYASGGKWSIIGSQLRRLNIGPMSRGRSHFMALLIDSAFRHGNVDFPGAESLWEAIHGPTLGEQVQLSWSRVRQTPTETVASVRLLAGAPNQYLRPGTDLIEPFSLLLSPSGVSLLSNGT